MSKIRHILNRVFRRSIVFNDQSRVEPISRRFGVDRGIPIDRYYIEKFLSGKNSLITGDVLEIAESTYSKKFGQNVHSFQILHFDDTNSKATIVGDLTRSETLPEERVDCFVCTQTLNFIFDVHKAIEGSYRLLKPGGVFLGTVSGISQISRYDMNRWGDYWRFTNLSIMKLFESVFGENNVEIVVYGNVLACMHFLQGVALDEIKDKSLLDVADNDYQLIIGIVATKKN